MRKMNVLSHSYELRSVLLTSSLILLTLIGCRSHKEVVSQSSLSLDSVAVSAHYRSVAVIDSLVRNIDFSFDTLKINIERPIAEADKPEIIRLKAYGGRVADNSREQKIQLEVSNQLDTVAYKKQAAETSTQHTGHAVAFTIPDGTIVSIAAILIAAILIYLLKRKK